MELNCAGTKKQGVKELVGLVHSIKHVTFNELMELVEDIARVKKREGLAYVHG
jgi:hypothetical protein